jgi:hypothetical protein
MFKDKYFSLLQIGVIGLRIAVIGDKKEETPSRGLLGVIFSPYGVGIDLLYFSITIF